MTDIRKWLDPADMPQWWYWTSLCIPALVYVLAWWLT